MPDLEKFDFRGIDFALMSAGSAIAKDMGAEDRRARAAS